MGQVVLVGAAFNGSPGVVNGLAQMMFVTLLPPTAGEITLLGTHFQNPVNSSNGLVRVIWS
jgi:hypothetical protein